MAHIVDDTQTGPNIIQLLNEAKQKVGYVSKTERNTAQNFSFRGIDTVVNAVGPVFNELGIVNTPEVLEQVYDTIEVGARKTTMGHILLTVKYTFYAPNMTCVSATVAGEAMDAGDKAVAKAMSVAWRTALLQVLNLPTDEPDPDSVSYDRNASAPVSVPKVKSAPAELVNSIVNATTLDQVRVAWKLAGASGDLLSITDRGISVQDLLYVKKDELEKAGK